MLRSMEEAELSRQADLSLVFSSKPARIAGAPLALTSRALRDQLELALASSPDFAPASPFHAPARPYLNLEASAVPDLGHISSEARYRMGLDFLRMAS